MDAVLDDLVSFAARDRTATQVLSDTQVRISRVIRGDPQTVWRAHHEPALLERWLHGRRSTVSTGPASPEHCWNPLHRTDP